MSREGGGGSLLADLGGEHLFDVLTYYIDLEYSDAAEPRIWSDTSLKEVILATLFGAKRFGSVYADYIRIRPQIISVTMRCVSARYAQSLLK